MHLPSQGAIIITYSTLYLISSSYQIIHPLHFQLCIILLIKCTLCLKKKNLLGSMMLYITKWTFNFGILFSSPWGLGVSLDDILSQFISFKFNETSIKHIISFSHNDYNDMILGHFSRHFIYLNYHICEVIKRSESYVGNFDFEI